jgi:predicted nucleotidyltransferase
MDKLRALKKKYEPEGFIIVGVFGSVARGEDTEQSDIDILYVCNDALFKKYKGWDFFGYYEKIKAEFEKELGRKVDLADQSALNKIGKKYILPELFYVS